ncbi:alpha-L-fucosidase-like [Diachasmimorpha longicaudata]|uniref:alpha-L-fucosidase-like n=1 Tax=Diachasmimorpha longicaudata TaxID=58733 RepID=UPI0030B8B5E8
MIFRVLLGICVIPFVQSKWDNNVYIISNYESEPKSSLRDSTGSFVPTWDSLDSRKLPSWFDDVKIGIFIHWGVFSVPSFGSEWFWTNWKGGSVTIRDFMKKNYKPGFSYQDFARDFTAEFYNATEWADLFEASGAKYVVLTSKHHEGYTLWPSKYSFSWNAMDVGPHRDLVGELADAVRRKKDIHFGLYHSLFEWYNPLYLIDKANNFSSDIFIQSKVLPEMYELVEKYRPDIIWSDGDWEATEIYWKSKEFLVWLFNESPVKDSVLVNDRWGIGTSCKHGSYYNCADRYNPGKLLSHKWENAMTIDKKSWGYRRNAPLEDYHTTRGLVAELVSTVSCGGNILINVGPTKDGIIPPIFQDRLKALGRWLKINGEAIYQSRPWTTQNDTITGDTWYTMSADHLNLYAIVLTWPEDNVLKLGALSSKEKYLFSMLGFSGPLKSISKGNRVDVYLPPNAHRGEPGWVVRIKDQKLRDIHQL